MGQARLGDEPLLFTVGYEGRSIDGFVGLLRREGVEQVADVRDNPWSRKPGFTGSELADALEDAGLGYEHLGDLGTPKPMRDALSEDEIADFESAYRDHLADQDDALARLDELARRAPTAILCMERDPEDCHRRFLAGRMADEGWSIVHL
jgi:uncharacterized protein (DUF488 family)